MNLFMCANIRTNTDYYKFFLNSLLGRLVVNFGRHCCHHYRTLLLDITLGPPFKTFLLDVTLEHHFLIPFLDVTFGHHSWKWFWGGPFGRHYAHHFLTSLLDITFTRHFYTSLLDAFMWKPLEASLPWKLNFTTDKKCHTIIGGGGYFFSFFY